MKVIITFITFSRVFIYDSMA